MLLEHMRKHQRWLMIIIAALVIISFAWFFNRAELNKIGREDIGVIYGRTVTLTEMGRLRRMVELSASLGLTNMVNQDFAFDSTYGWNVLVLRNEAERMGIHPSDEEVAETIQRLPAFQNNGKFDSAKFDTFIGKDLGSKGFGLRQVEEVVRLDLQMGRIRQMLEPTAVAGPTEVRAAFDEAHSQVELQVARLKLADFTATVQVSDDDVKKVYEDPAKKKEFTQDAKRKVKYVKVELTDEEKKLTGVPKKDALQRIAGKAEALADAMQESGADLTKVATGLGLAELIKETPEFDRASIAGLPEVALPGFQQAALALNNDNNKVSDVIQGTDSFYILAVSGWTPERPLTLEEAKPQIVRQLQQERAKTALEAKMTENRAKIAEAMKAGKTFDEATTAVGMKAENYPLFSMSNPSFVAPDSSAITQASREMTEGELSKPVPTSEGSDLIFLLRRLPADNAKFETMKDSLANALRSRRRMAAVREWIRTARVAANFKQTVELREN